MSQLIRTVFEVVGKKKETKRNDNNVKTFINKNV